MVDGDRIYPVEYHFLHHSTGPEFYNADPLTVQDWYSNIGKDRGYNGGAINPRHEHPGRPGQLTYAQAHFSLYRYDKDGNKYGWKLIDLIKNPYANVAWAVGNWWYNQRSVSTEVCGNYLNQVLPDKALMLMADYMRPVDVELGGRLQVWLHQEVYATACPARIKEQRDKLVDMINNPDKWNKQLWPPTPVITKKEVTTTESVPFSKESREDNTLPKGEIKILHPGVNGVRTIVTEITYTDGKETSRKVLSNKITTQPITEVTLIGTYVEPPKPPVDPIDPGDGEDAASWLSRVWVWIMEILKSFTFKK